MRLFLVPLAVLLSVVLLAAPLGPLAPAGTAQAVVCIAPPQGEADHYVDCMVDGATCLALAVKAWLLKEDPVYCPA